MDKPFIHLLRSPNSGYFYDVNRNEIVPVDDDVYYLLKEDKSGLKAAIDEDKLRPLKHNGYLSSTTVENISHPYTPYSVAILSRAMRKIALQITQNCNFMCKYCVYSQINDKQRHHSNRKMSLETAFKAVVFLKEHSVDSDDVCIGFYGGEPLLEFELIKQVINFAEKEFEGKKIIYTLTTNASLLSDEHLEFFERIGMKLVISFDGVKEVHDKNRVFAMNGQGTYDTVMKNLHHAYVAFPEYYKENVTVNTVMDPSISFEKINQLYSSNDIISHTNCQTTVIDDTSSDTPNYYAREYLIEYEYNSFLGLLSAINRFPLEYLSPIIKQEISMLYTERDKMYPMMGLHKTGIPNGPCIPGENRALITVDEHIIVCERVNEISDCMIIGNLSNDFDHSKIRKLMNIAKTTEQECQNCWAFNHCGLCCKFSDDGNSLSRSMRLSHCEKNKLIAHNKLRKFIFLQEAYSMY